MIKQVGDAAAAGVTSLTTSDDAWVTVDPDLDGATGAVTLNLAHGTAGTATSTKEASANIASKWGETASVTVPKVGIDAKGHVSVLDTTSVNVVTLPATPVTSLTTLSSDNEVYADLSSSTGNVTVTVSHAIHNAVKAGEVADKTLTKDDSSFKVLEVSTNKTGHVISATARTITLPATAFSDTTYTFTGGTQSFSVVANGSTLRQNVSVAHMPKQTTDTQAAATDGTYLSNALIDDYGHVYDTAYKSNGVYSDDTDHADGEIVVWAGATNEAKTSNMTIRNGAISDDSSTTTIPTT